MLGVNMKADKLLQILRDLQESGISLSRVDVLVSKSKDSEETIELTNHLYFAGVDELVLS
jgi:hypothetical protein